MSYKVTHQNHLSIRKTADYSVKIGRCNRMPMDFKSEALRAARLIAQENDNIWISYSGGIDSEFIICVFLEAGIDFKVATVAMKNKINEYDLQHSRSFCHRAGIKLHEFEIDVEEFYRNELETYAVATNCISPQFPVHMWLWDQLDGLIVAGHGDPIFKCKDREWYLQIQEKEDSVFRYAKWRDRNMAPGFYVYTPELLLSFMLEQEVSNMFLAPKRAGLKDIQQVKHLVYSKYYDINAREKQTGFEYIQDLDTKYRTDLKNKISGHGVFLQPVRELLDRLWPNL